MSAAAILLVKDEADIIGTTVEHLLAHVDEVIVYDNLSNDGTREILEALPVTLHTDGDPAYYQADKTTAAALKAYASGHTWVVPCDADEIWLPAQGRLAEVLGSMPAHVDVAVAALHDHVPTDADDLEVADPVARMGWREVAQGDLPKVACRLTPSLRIHQGNHGCDLGRDGVAVQGALSIRHFPYRSREQMVSKYSNGAAAYKLAALDPGTGWHWRRAGRILEELGDQGADMLWEERLRLSPATSADLTLDPTHVR